MRKPVASLLLLSFCVGGCKENLSADQSTPQSVAEIMFASARTGKYDILKNLCSSDIDTDSDSKKVCEVSGDAALQQNFSEYFTKGKIIGEPTIDGNKAVVKILFGPDGNREESLNLVKKDGKWFLASF